MVGYELKSDNHTCTGSVFVHAHAYDVHNKHMHYHSYSVAINTYYKNNLTLYTYQFKDSFKCDIEKSMWVF